MVHAVTEFIESDAPILVAAAAKRWPDMQLPKDAKDETWSILTPQQWRAAQEADSFTATLRFTPVVSGSVRVLVGELPLDDAAEHESLAGEAGTGIVDYAAGMLTVTPAEAPLPETATRAAYAFHAALGVAALRVDVAQPLAHSIADQVA